MTPPGSSPTWTTAAARPAWPGASRTTRITRSALWEVFTRYIGLGRQDRPDLDRDGRGHPDGRPPGRGTSHRSRSRRSTPRAPRTSTGRSWTGSPGSGTRGRPFFAFLNYNDAHTPYEVPDDRRRASGSGPSSWHDRLVLQQWNTLDKTKLPYHDVQMANDVYDDCIAYLDRRLGALLDELRRRGVLDDTLVIVTSDHGEHLGDHLLFFHGCSLYRQARRGPAGDRRSPRRCRRAGWSPSR